MGCQRSNPVGHIHGPFQYAITPDPEKLLSIKWCVGTGSDISGIDVFTSEFVEVSDLV